MIDYRVDESRRLHVSYPEEFGAEYHRREMRRTSLLVPKTGPLLDIGCGSGLISRFLPLKTEYVGIDFNTNYLTGWKGRQVEARLVGNILRLPLQDECFNTVLLLHVIEHLPAGQQLDLLREVSRVMVKRGTLLLSTPNLGTLRNADKFLPPNNPKHFHCLKIDDVKLLLRAAGFANIRRHGYDIIIEFPNRYLRLVPEVMRRKLAQSLPPMEKHLIFTATRL